jgi:putative phosphoesterase
MTLRVGLISDTHGLLRPAALHALRSSDYIVHAGDIGTADILSELEAIAPVIAVRGNNDHGNWAQRLPEVAVLDVGDVRIGVIHDVKLLTTDPQRIGYRAVVSGHSHQPKVSEHDDVLYVNPGSAGPRRFKLPVSVAQHDIAGASVRARLITLDA